MDKKQNTESKDIDAVNQAKRDLASDPDFQPTSATDDLDEGELARKDNSDEKPFDALENKNPRPA